MGSGHVLSAILLAAAATGAFGRRAAAATPRYPDKPVRLIVSSAPAGRIAREVGRTVDSGDVRDRLAADGAQPARPMAVERFEESDLREVAKWEQFVRKAKGAA